MNLATRYSSEKLNRVIRVQGRRIGWVAEQIGVDDSYISKLRHGAKPITPDLAERLARVLGIPVESLLDDSEDEPHAA